jgi:uncharacterized protein (TIRG00374 family)
MDGTLSERRLHFWLGMAISIVCLAALLLFIKPADILEALRHTQFGWLALAALALVLFLVLRAVRWRFLLNSGQARDANLHYAIVFHVQNIGYMLSNILPFRLGDVARAVLIGNVPPMTISRGLSTMVAERIFDLAFVVILFPFTLSAVGDLPAEVQAAFRLVGVLSLTATALLIVAANQRRRANRLARAVLMRISRLDTEAWARRFDDLLLGLSALTRLKDGLILLLLSALIWLPIVASYYFGLRAVNLEPTLLQAAFVVCIAAFSVTAPSSPGQVGVYEAGVTFGLAGILGLPEAQSASFAFLYHAVNFLTIGVLGVIGILSTPATFGSVIESTRALVQTRAK